MYEKAGKALGKRMASAQPYDSFEVAIFLTEEPARDYLMALEAPPASDEGSAGVESIKRQCAKNQAGLIDFLSQRRTETFAVDDESSILQVGPVESFWINNSVATEVSLDVLESILSRPDVQHVELVRTIELEELLDTPGKRGRGKGREKSAVKATVDSFLEPGKATWSVKRVGAPLLWQKGITGSSVVVAVLDTGVNYEHPDLNQQMWDGGTQFPNHGYDFASGDKDPMDEQGHGTACAGIVAGNGMKGKQTGVAPEATIMAVRVGGRETHFWRGMEFAVEQGAHVISMSMSWKYPWHPDYPGWRRACESILASGVLHANSIGNQGHLLNTHPVPYNIATPGNCPPPWLHPLQVLQGDLSSAIACGATDANDELAYYSGRGPAAWETAPYTDYPYATGTKTGLIKPDICAPGPGTESCSWRYPQDPQAKPYRDFGGTSSATPHVGGCLALLAQACIRTGKSILPSLIQQAIENTAVRVQGQKVDKENHFGSGRIDVFAAHKYGASKGWWS